MVLYGWFSEVEKFKKRKFAIFMTFSLTRRPRSLRSTFSRQALRHMEIPPKLKFIQLDRYDKQREFP